MFQNAKPVWPKGRSREKNVFAAFALQAGPALPDGKLSLHVTGATFYRVYVGGAFLGFGPARTAFGYAREDVFSLARPESGNIHVVIEVCGYYCRSLSTVLQPSFLMAELRCGEQPLAWTNASTPAFCPDCKLQQVERYSKQRHFTEIWDYRGFVSMTDPRCRVETEELPQTVQILDRVVPYPDYAPVELPQAAIKGALTYDPQMPCIKERYSGGGLPRHWHYFEYDTIAHHPYAWLQQQKQRIEARDILLPEALGENEYLIFDFGRIEAGFFRLEIEALEDSDVVIGFSEYYQGEDFQFQNMNCHNVVEFFLSGADRREVESFEPYTCRFAIVAVKKGGVKLRRFGIRSFMFPLAQIEAPEFGDSVLRSICRAGIRTFAHNAVDLYTDCPSRERAGWLCDSYFTAKTEYALTGKTQVEDAFLENYRLFQNRGEYMEGVLPMCYPSEEETDLPGGKFIPQWTMWYILEAAEYILQRGHQDKKELFRKSIYDLLHFYQQYENADGLLERLPSWNFVEWSTANEWTWDVNYPTNFLYAQVLQSIAMLYDDADCARRSEEVRKAAVEQSYNGQYFLDHALRDELGNLCLQSHSSEACQYYAILFGGIDWNEPRFAPLKELVVTVFTPDRLDAMPQIIPVNAFIGAYLRIEALLKMGEYTLLLENIRDFFGKMEQRTGTLWEYRQLKGSYDHGFASYAVAAAMKACK